MFEREFRQDKRNVYGVIKITKIQKASFLEQINHIKGMKVKRITNNKEQVAIIFNDKFGTALYFTPRGKFNYIGLTTKYMSK